MVCASDESDRDELMDLVDEAWRQYDRFRSPAGHVAEYPPILYVGDEKDYRKTHLRIVTVSLNPSRQGIEGRDAEFPGWLGLSVPAIGQEPDRYIAGLNSFFRAEPEKKKVWFRSFENVLSGMEASYYDGKSRDDGQNLTSPVLHTDLCSPLMTDPNWSGLGEECEWVSKALQDDGIRLWHRLVEFLKPNIILASIARPHFGDMRFTCWNKNHDLANVETWHEIHTVTRKNPYVVRGTYVRFFDDDGDKHLLVWGKAAQTPFGSVSYGQMTEIGKSILQYWNATK